MNRDILREKVKDWSSLGEEIKRTMNSGKLISDKFANEIIVQTILDTEEQRLYDGLLLDGYPRTLFQAQYFDLFCANQSKRDFSVVNIQLDASVAVAKLLGRRICKTCGDSFNTAHIVKNGYDMPAILPSSQTCKLGPTACNPDLLKRDDDTAETITTRIAQHDINTAPILEYYQKKGVLKTFNVYKGVKDVDALIKLINI